MQPSTVSRRVPSLSQPPEVKKAKAIQMIEHLVSIGAEEQARLVDQQENIGYFAHLERLKSRPQDAYLDQLITVDPAMIRLKEKVSILVNTDDTVLIIGETGTGKELIARALHAMREKTVVGKDVRTKIIRKGSSEEEEREVTERYAQFVDLNCSGLPEHLIEAELFGYEEGAFTGASKGGKQGLFQQAEKGTIFLDEIGELPLNTQAKLLRVLQEKRVRKVGALTSEPISCRVVCATHHPLREMSHPEPHGQYLFRRDLYYRISTVELHTTPLRERLDDIPLIIKELDKNKGTFPTDFSWSRYLGKYPPGLLGNVRELQQIVRRYQLFGELPTV